MAKTQAIGFHCAEFNDIDQYAQAVSSQDVRSYQLGAGALNILLREMVFPDLIVRHIRSNRKMEETFFLKPGWTTFSLSPGTDISNGFWCGVQTVPNVIGILRSGREHHSCIPGGWDALEVDVPDVLLVNEGIISEQVLNDAMTPEKGLLPLSVKSAHRLRSWLQSLLEDDDIIHRIQSNKNFTSKLRKQLLSALSKTLKEGIHATTQLPQRHPFRRYSLLCQAIGIIEQHSWQHLTIDTIVNSLGINTRTLQRVFKEHYQLSPYQYLLRRRLNAAHLELARTPTRTGKETIASIANRFGFSSSSQFTEHYKKLFNELPSSTLIRLEHCT